VSLGSRQCLSEPGVDHVRVLLDPLPGDVEGVGVGLADHAHQPAELLVVHDELDLPPGTLRLKRGGGHGGHNGLRDIIAHCGGDFLRLRIGIGHPGSKAKVVGYVLRPPGKDELTEIEHALDASRRAIDRLYATGLEAAMQDLHTATPPKDITDDLGPAG